MKSKLKTALERRAVPRGGVGLAWLGQAGFVLKGPGGTLLALDPYLSDSCRALGAAGGLDMRRQVPAPLAAGELVDFDAIAFTHSHQDHVDPATIQPYLRLGGRASLIAPHDAAELLLGLGAAPDRILRVWPNRVHQVGDFTLKATFAIPFGGDDMTHVGYLVDVRGGPRIYFTGDTDYNEILPISVAPYRPEIMVTVINPAFRNLSPLEAARLALALRPRWVIPCHYDMFPDNSLPPRLLRTNLSVLGIAETYCPLEHGVVRIFRRERGRARPGKALL